MLLVKRVLKTNIVVVNMPLKLLPPGAFFSPKMNKISFGGRATEGAYSAPTDHLAGFKGGYF